MSNRGALGSTVTVELPGCYSSTTLYTYTHKVQFTPPANIAGKLCKVYVDEMVSNLVLDSGTFTGGQMVVLESNWPQPNSSYITADTTYNSTTQGQVYQKPNTVLSMVATNSVYIPTTRYILCQMNDGPSTVEFTISTTKLGTSEDQTPTSGYISGYILYTDGTVTVSSLVTGTGVKSGTEVLSQKTSGQWYVNYSQTVGSSGSPISLTITEMSYTNVALTGTNGFTPTVMAMLHVVPANSKDHHEDLEAFSTGPFVRF